MNKLLLLFLCTVLSACTTVKYIPENGNTVSTEVIQSITTQAVEDPKDTLPLSLEEKYSIISLFEELRPHELEVKQYKPVIALELACLAEVIYFEARGEGDEGMLAVGHVVLNRASDERFPKTICGVIKQGKHVKGKPLRHKCQFSYYCDGLSDVITDEDSYIKSTKLAFDILSGRSNNPVSNSLFYHATYVRPRWSKVFALVRRINKHLFYTYRDLVIASK